MDLFSMLTAYGTVMAIQLGNVGLQAYLRHRRNDRLPARHTTRPRRGRGKEER